LSTADGSFNAYAIRAAAIPTPAAIQAIRLTRVEERDAMSEPALTKIHSSATATRRSIATMKGPS